MCAQTAGGKKTHHKENVLCSHLYLTGFLAYFILYTFKYIHPRRAAHRLPKAAKKILCIKTKQNKTKKPHIKKLEFKEMLKGKRSTC
jgi:hypothetical protein